MATIPPRHVDLKDGGACVIRSASLDDAEALIDYVTAMAPTAPYIATSPEDIDLTLEQEQRFIAQHNDADNGLFLVAEADGGIVGVLNFAGERRVRARHTGALGMSTLEAHRGRGVGRALMTTLLDWAEAHPTLERVALSVMPDNTAAVALYRSMGFVEEGRRPRAFRLAPDRYADELLMARFVDGQR